VISVPLAFVSSAAASLRRLVGQLGLCGIFSAEFKRDEREGSFKLIEVNPRPWWYVEFAATCGADVCVPAYRDALGLPVGEASPYRHGVRLVYPYYDWLAWRDAADASITFPDLARFWLGATQAEWRLDDPLPAVANLARLVRGWLGRRLSPRKRGATP
jgi:predicted ATP-grasp superfamily ATP-dependent carboligase